MKISTSLEFLINSLKLLPGIGPRSAERIANHLLQYDREVALQLSNALKKALEDVKHCKSCNGFSEKSLCPLCQSHKRDHTLLCVVEMPTDIGVIEQTKSYNGLYYVLMGRLSPLDGIGPKEIQFQKLLDRVAQNEIREVILATNFTMEGEATAHYIAEMLQSFDLKVSRIARGLPVGGELEFADGSTVGQSVLDRKKI